MRSSYEHRTDFHGFSTMSKTRRHNGAKKKKSAPSLRVSTASICLGPCSFRNLVVCAYFQSSSSSSRSFWMSDIETVFISFAAQYKLSDDSLYQSYLNQELPTRLFPCNLKRNISYRWFIIILIFFSSRIFVAVKSSCSFPVRFQCPSIGNTVCSWPIFQRLPIRPHFKLLQFV